MYSISYTNEFKKQAKLMQKRGCNIELLNEAIKKLIKDGLYLPTNIKHTN